MGEEGIPRSEFHERIKNCQAIASERGFDGLIVIGGGTNRGDMIYLSNHIPTGISHRIHYDLRGVDLGVLVIPVDEDPVLIVAKGFYDKERIVTEDVRDSLINVPKALGDILTELRLNRSNIGLAGEDVLPVTLYKELQKSAPQVNLCQADDIVIGLRMVKSESERKLLEKGARIADQTMEVVRDFISEGKTELEVANKIASSMREFGADRGSATCQSGAERSNEPIVQPIYSRRKLQKGDMMHFEIRGSLGGYGIDTCRSTVVGQPSKKQRDILETIIEAMDAAIKAIKPGVKAEYIEEVAAEVVTERGYGQGHFTVPYGGPQTYLAHCIGLTSEPPYITKGDKTVLKPWMGPITMEPGLYRTDVGGARIEDEVFPTENGFKLLNHYDRVWW